MGKHYIRVNGEIVVHGFSDEFEHPLDTDICINENGGRHFELLGETNPVITNIDGTHRFRYVGQTTNEVIEVIEDVTDDVIVDTSNVQLEGAVVSNIDINAIATGYKTIPHSSMIVRYATAEELAEELANIPVPEHVPTEMDKLREQMNLLQEQNMMLVECVLEMSEVVYGGI